jgi:FKBP-type peptidyl-prolyl cis-trans isomerase FklB
MKQFTYIKSVLAFLVALLCLSSCSETDDTVEEYADWQDKNEAFFLAKYNTAKQAIASGDRSWKLIKSFARADSIEGTPTDYIVVKVLREGTGSGSPLYTDTVRVHYRGQLLASATHVDENDRELGLVFDMSWSNDTFNEAISVPSKFGVARVVDGFSTALQHMHIGDRWKVYIPHELGYGSSSSSQATAIPPYSVLVFDMALAAYYRPGDKVPNWSANHCSLWEEGLK